MKNAWTEFPSTQGLYSFEQEKDSCGVGLLVNLSGQPSHRLLVSAQELLGNLSHRGAVGAHNRDGDGAGVMTALPDTFFQLEAQRLGFKLPAKGLYAAGNLFLPSSQSEHSSGGVRQEDQDKLKCIFEDCAREVRLKVLGWRRVPTDGQILGPVSLGKEPSIWQPFLILDLDKEESVDERYFERQLYVLRKYATHKMRQLGKDFYICSLSSKNIVYKGQLTPVQVWRYFYDLNRVDFETHFALVHSRFSTNTFPSWERSQPMRWCAHNGEINTLRGNINWMRAREGVLKSSLFHKDLERLYPIIEPFGSDSAAFDNVLELLVVNGVLSLPEAVMIMIPEAWQNNSQMPKKKRDFYQWAACLMEPWDGPALFAFSDGRYCGASLDRNGLRPCRYYLTKDGMMICASEVGCARIEPENVEFKGRLQPGKMLLVDTQLGRIVQDEELKQLVSERAPFGEWIRQEMLSLDSIVEIAQRRGEATIGGWEGATVGEDQRLKAFGYTLEQMNMLLLPMCEDGKEALGSMGNDAPLACLSKQPRLIYDYFRQLFAQVTNPPIDPIREEIVMSLETYIGPEGNLMEMHSSQCRRLLLPSPILDLNSMNCIHHLQRYAPTWPVYLVSITFPRDSGIEGYFLALERICAEVSKAILDGSKIVILSDRKVGPDECPVSAAIAIGTVHQYLIKNKHRSRVGLIVETGEAREVHHFCVLLGYGADGICPYLAQETILKLRREGATRDIPADELIQKYITASNQGILKVMSKMGISTLQSYKGAQIFEALGLCAEVVERCFDGTPSRISGVGFEWLARDALTLHHQGWPQENTNLQRILIDRGEYHWRDGGEEHLNHPTQIAALQDAVRRKNDTAYQKYSLQAQSQVGKCTLRGLLEFCNVPERAIPIEEVEPWTFIVRRFCTGAMSYGSISLEAHTALAAAMNRLGGKSNTGEGGEDPERSEIRVDGDSWRSAIKQVASGRFGVTSYYLADADELQIKMAQGAKPGEGGELPGHKVSESIAKTRKSTPGVGLISPPPHHDIYSIEDLKQLIYDLKCSNPRARISVKLVSEVGVGVVASGVAKAKADHILISGHDGGTGASRWTGIKYAGLPWELGLAETHQTLVLNGLRGRVVLQCDGQLRTGRDLAIACLLGAEEWGFATAPLIAMGCTMMRKCHLNTCPVGIATQDPELRLKFAGTPEHVVNFFYYVAEELRGIMARLGFRTVEQMVGHCELLRMKPTEDKKLQQLNLAGLLEPAWRMRPGVPTFWVKKQDHALHQRLDNALIAEAEKSIELAEPTVLTDIPIVNTERALGTTLSYYVSRKHGETGLPEDCIRVELYGSAGQSFGAFLAPGITLQLEGDGNDYVGKGLSGGKIIIKPPRESSFASEENVIVGNVCLYGATSGYAFLRGMAAERFAVRNSGAKAVVEGVGDHGCEYMTGGVVVVLGRTGRNFAAGMSGGLAYVYLHDAKSGGGNWVTENCNAATVSITYGPLRDNDRKLVLELMEQHLKHTGSSLAASLLKDFSSVCFYKILPKDYERALLAAAAAPAISSPFSITTPTAVTKNEPDIEDLLAKGDSDKSKLKKLKERGFMWVKREAEPYRHPERRSKDWQEISKRLPTKQLRFQASRCMDCGIPFCQSDTGCPISNVIPQWNDLVSRNDWRQALDRLLLTNNFPEFTGRVCPAPCEGACVLGINELPVNIKSIECAIIDRAFDEGWMVPRPPVRRTGKKVAVIGSGPAGLACADELNRAGHLVSVFERHDRIGGLLMYGIPNMKLDKRVVERRLKLMTLEGVCFYPNVEVGIGVSASYLRSNFDAIVCCTGSTTPRDLVVPNRSLKGIHFAMDFLHKNTKSLLDSSLENGKYISAEGKNVIVIGGGDTGCDCIGTAIRHGAASVINLELLPKPPTSRAPDNPWPEFPRTFKLDYGHAEAHAKYSRDPREFSVMTTDFVSNAAGDSVAAVNTRRIKWERSSKGAWEMVPVPGSEQTFPADLVLLAMGFTGTEPRVAQDLGCKLERQLFLANDKDCHTSVEGVFAAGDCRRGQSLVVWAIREGRQAARQADAWLEKRPSLLPSTVSV